VQARVAVTEQHFKYLPADELASLCKLWGMDNTGTARRLVDRLLDAGMTYGQLRRCHIKAMCVAAGVGACANRTSKSLIVALVGTVKVGYNAMLMHAGGHPESVNRTTCTARLGKPAAVHWHCHCTVQAVHCTLPLPSHPQGA
jgi:hypothetical protein